LHLEVRMRLAICFRAGDARGPSKWLCTVLTFVISPPSPIMHFARAVTVDSARSRRSSCQGTKRYACPPEKGNSHRGNGDAEWLEIRLEKRMGNCIFCDRACATDAVGKARVFLNSERPIGALSPGQESLQFVIGGEGSWNDGNGRVWETGTTLSI
jgi:hypothetical protein